MPFVWQTLFFCFVMLPKVIGLATNVTLKRNLRWASIGRWRCQLDAAGAAYHCVDDGPLHHIPVFVAGDLGVGGSVKREEAKHEDESPEGGQRDRVAWNVSAGPVSIKSSNPRSKE